MVFSAWRLLQYFQLFDKNSRNISRYSYNFFAVFQNSNVFIPLFLSEPLTVFCRTLFEKHCSSQSSSAHLNRPFISDSFRMSIKTNGDHRFGVTVLSRIPCNEKSKEQHNR
jgi:hypothetical protein